MSSEFEREVLQALGELKGEVRGLNALVVSHEQTMNRRMDDLQRANDARIKAVGRRISAVETQLKTHEKECSENSSAVMRAINKLHLKVVAGASAGGGLAGGLVVIARMLLGIE